LLPNTAEAQDIYWKLRQEGFLFSDGLIETVDRMLDAKHADRAAAIIEDAYRARPKLSSIERLRLVEAYETLDRPLDALRAKSDE
jgi:hypothetical protein